MKQYDLIVIGSGPSGEKAAVKAAYFKKNVALIEKQNYHGGAGVNTGTLPSKALKQTAVYLSGKYDKDLFGIERKLEKKASIEHFLYHKNQIMKQQRQAVKENLVNHGVKLYHGQVSFIDQQTISISPTNIKLKAKYFLIATGSYPVHPPHIPFDNKRVHDSDTILNITYIPKSISILGAGIIGCEYASIFQTMGVQVNLINSSEKILSFLDHEISLALIEEMRSSGIKIHYDTTVSEIIYPKEEELKTTLTNGKTIKSEMFLFAAGRNGCTKDLNLKKIGITVDKREVISVNDKYQTKRKNIFAVGDVIGFPALASTGMDQGRVAINHIFKTNDIEHINKTLPFGIYTVPEISMVGITENEAKELLDEFVTGHCLCTELPKGQLLGCKSGFLKLIVRKKDGVILGVHMIGPLSTEVIHYGMTLVNNKVSVHELIGHVFNFPTLHDLYKKAAYEALKKIALKI